MNMLEACNLANQKARGPVFVAAKDDTAQIILDNTRDIAELRVAITDIRSAVAENTRDIAELRVAITDIRSAVAENTQSIAEMKGAISALTELIKTGFEGMNQRLIALENRA